MITMVLAGAAIAAACKEKAPQNSPTESVQSPEVSAENVEAALAAAQEYLNVDDGAKAQAILLTLIDRAPEDPRARELYGQTLKLLALQAQKAGDDDAARSHHEKAYEQYEIALKFDPESAGLHHSAGLMALAINRNDAALNHFRSAGRLEPYNKQYSLFEAQLLIQSRRFDEARRALEWVLVLDKDEALAHASLAMIALEEADFEKALGHMATARQIEPADIELRAQEARIHRRRGEPNRALELLVGLSDQERAQEIVAYEIAASHADLGDHLSASRAWQHCYQANPRNPKAWLAAVRAGEAYLRAGDRKQARRWLEEAQLLAPNQAQVKALEEALVGRK
ncbi:MAG: hypothetical protein L0Y44_14010 [Phycisphaerales bacterium]|nr:hypothetical protein [Phycisphaerales bacterium]MCI0631759.1 hypothetical protein [Phycisphaerales bacterium]